MPSQGDFRTTRIPSERLWKALTETLEIFGDSMKDATIVELQKQGIDLERDGQDRSLADIGEKLSSIFGKDGTEVIIEQIGKKLKLP